MDFSVTKDGKALGDKLYTWDAETKTFSTKENRLVLDFSNESGIIFKTGSYCKFKTGSNCTFRTGHSCTFNTGSYCMFKTGSHCTFNTGSNCKIDTGSHCTFNTGSNCIFDTVRYCTFKTGSICIFKTSSYCEFNCKENCVCIRRDIYEIIEIPVDQQIKLNDHRVKGYKVVNTIRKITIDGKEIEVSEESYQNLKKTLIDA